MTRHAAHPLSVEPRRRGDALTPAFVSDLSSLIDSRQPGFWLHGHTHASFDYQVHPLERRPTRVLCNPRGYSESENPDFRWHLLVEV